MAMEAFTGRELARRESPYGLAVVPDTERPGEADPRHEAAIQRRWQPVCEQYGAAIVGVRDVPISSERLALDGIEWELRPLGTAEHVVPPEVYHRWRALEAAGVPFLYWLW